jgi:FkbM family methyltransferase
MNLKQTKCSKGVFIHLEKDLYIPESLVKYDGWENEIYDECKQYLKPNSNIIEVGAHIGTHTIPLSKLVPQGFVYAFEMQRFIHQLLCTNIILNHCGNIHTYQEGVSNQKGEVKVGLVDHNHHDNSGNVKLLDVMMDAGYPLHVTTLDHKFEFLKKVDLIKVDVECHELEVLQGAYHLIKHHRPIIVTEYHTIKTKHTNGNQQQIKNLLPNYTWREVNGVYNLNNKEIHNFNMIGEPK